MVGASNDDDSFADVDDAFHPGPAFLNQLLPWQVTGLDFLLKACRCTDEDHPPVVFPPQVDLDGDLALLQPPSALVRPAARYRGAILESARGLGRKRQLVALIAAATKANIAGPGGNQTRVLIIVDNSAAAQRWKVAARQWWPVADAPASITNLSESRGPLARRTLISKEWPAAVTPALVSQCTASIILATVKQYLRHYATDALAAAPHLVIIDDVDDVFRRSPDDDAVGALLAVHPGCIRVCSSGSVRPKTALQLFNMMRVALGLGRTKPADMDDPTTLPSLTRAAHALHVNIGAFERRFDPLINGAGHSGDGDGHIIDVHAFLRAIGPFRHTQDHRSAEALLAPARVSVKKWTVTLGPPTQAEQDARELFVGQPEAAADALRAIVKFMNWISNLGIVGHGVTDPKAGFIVAVTAELRVSAPSDKLVFVTQYPDVAQAATEIITTTFGGKTIIRADGSRETTGVLSDVVTVLTVGCIPRHDHEGLGALATAKRVVFLDTFLDPEVEDHLVLQCAATSPPPATISVYRLCYDSPAEQALVRMRDSLSGIATVVKSSTALRREKTALEMSEYNVTLRSMYAKLADAIQFGVPPTPSEPVASVPSVDDEVLKAIIRQSSPALSVSRDDVHLQIPSNTIDSLRVNGHIETVDALLGEQMDRRLVASGAPKSSSRHIDDASSTISSTSDRFWGGPKVGDASAAQFCRSKRQRGDKLFEAAAFVEVLRRGARSTLVASLQAEPLPASAHGQLDSLLAEIDDEL